MYFVNLFIPETAYIITQNTSAFKQVVQEPEIFSFCYFVMELDEQSKNGLRRINITNSNTLNAVVESINDRSLQLVRDWLRIRNGNYEKTVNQGLNKYKKDISNKKLDISNFSDTEKNDLDYMAKQFFVEDCWEEYQRRMADDFQRDPTIPLAMICLTDILKDVDLLIGFLCCNSTSRELLLTKAQELAEQENGHEQ